MGRIFKAWRNRGGCFEPLPVLGAVSGTEDYEVEADDGYDLVEHIRTAKHFGRDAFLETDVDFFG